VQHQRTRIHIPQNRNVVPHEILLRGFARAPVGGYRGKFAHHQRLDVRARRFLVIRVGANIADVRIGQADDLARVTRIGEDFLIAGEAGIENDFAAAARDGARRAAVKYAPVFQSENGGAVLNFGQFVLRAWS
jgi:hypothetical protein